MHSILFVQFSMALGSILLVTFITGRLFLKLRQPVVVGEMIAGILIGPTLLGSVFPGLANLFSTPAGSGVIDSHTIRFYSSDYIRVA